MTQDIVLGLGLLALVAAGLWLVKQFLAAGNSTSTQNPQRTDMVSDGGGAGGNGGHTRDHHHDSGLDGGFDGGGDGGGGDGGD